MTTNPPTWVVALVNPEGEPEAWLTRSGQVTPAIWDAAHHASSAEAATAALVFGQRLANVDGRVWRVVEHVVAVTS